MDSEVLSTTFVYERCNVDGPTDLIPMDLVDPPTFSASLK
jgi:hypothetical protein